MPLRKEDFVIHLARCVAKGVDPKAIALPILETEIPGFTDRMDMEYFLSKSEASVKKHECKASAPALSKESDSTLAEIGRLKSSSEEIRQDLFVEYGKSLSLLLGQIDQHPNGLYPYSIINMVYFYIDIIMPLYEADIRRRLYPEMGVLMTHALSINFDNSLLTAHHFVLDSDKHRLADYIQFLKTKSSSNNKTVLFYNEGAKRFDFRHIDMINSVATMLLNDIDVEPSLRSLPIFEKITTRCFMDFGDKKILGTKEQLEAYKQHLTLQVKMHNTMNSLAPAMSSLSNGSLFTDPSLNGYWPGRHFPAQYNFSNPLSSVSQASFEEWAITSGRITPKLELDIVDAVVAIEEISRKLSQKGDSKSSSDLSSILQFKYENVQSLMLNIITLFGDEDKYKELLLSNYSEGGLLVCFNNYSLHYHGFGAETKELLNRFFAVAGQDARLQNNLLYFVSKSLDQSIDNIKNPKFKAYQENMGLFLESVIEYNYLYCFTSTDGAFPIVDLFYNMKLFPKQRDLLCQTINDVRARDLDFSANPNIMHIKYNILLNKGSDSIYSQVLKTSPEIKWLFDRIVFIKISKELPSINLSQIAKMGNYIDITIESADINEVNRFLETILNVQNYQRVRDLFFRTTTDAQGNEKSCLTNYFSTRFYKLLIKDSESAIKLIAVAFNEGGKDGKPHALKEYYLKQTFIHLLGRKKYSMLNSLYNLEPDLFSSYLTSDAKLRNISDKHFEALDNESLKSSITKLEIPKLLEYARSYLSTILTLKHKINIMKQDRESLHSDAKGLMDDFQRFIDSKKSEFERFQPVSLLKDKISSQSKEISSLTKDISALKSQIQQLDLSNSEGKVQIGVYMVQIQELEHNLAKIKKDLDAVNAGKDLHDRQLKNSKQDKEKQGKKIIDLRSEVERLKLEFERASQKAGDLIICNQRQQLELEAALSKCSIGEGLIADQQKDIDGLIESLAIEQRRPKLKVLDESNQLEYENKFAILKAHIFSNFIITRTEECLSLKEQPGALAGYLYCFNFEYSRNLHTFYNHHDQAVIISDIEKFDKGLKAVYHQKILDDSIEDICLTFDVTMQKLCQSYAKEQGFQPAPVYYYPVPTDYYPAQDAPNKHIGGPGI